MTITSSISWYISFSQLSKIQNSKIASYLTKLRQRESVIELRHLGILSLLLYITETLGSRVRSEHQGADDLYAIRICEFGQ